MSYPLAPLPLPLLPPKAERQVQTLPPGNSVFLTPPPHWVPGCLAFSRSRVFWPELRARACLSVPLSQRRSIFPSGRQAW